MRMNKRDENKPGYKKTKTGWIPEEWKCVPFTKLFDRASLPVTVEPEATYREIGIRSHCKGIFLKEEVVGRTLGNKRVFWCQPGTLVFNIVFAWEQAVAILGAETEGLIASHRFPMYKAKNGCASEMFYLWFFSSPRGKHGLALASPGGAGRNKTLGQGELNFLFLPVPPLPEQKRIADLLSTWDRAIALSNRLIDAKQRLKKGLMQQLLIGRMRFPEFGKPVKEKGKLPEDWEIKPLGSFGSFSKGKGISNNLKRETGFPCITYGEIYGKHEIVIKDFCSCIDGDTAHNSQLISKGDILFAGSGETLNEIGKCVAFTKDEEAYAGGDIVIFHPESVYSLYLSYSLNSDLLIRQKRKLGQGHSVVHIYSAGLKTLQVPLPNLEEQTCIASILSVCDREIQLLAQKRDRLHEQKKGMIQKLLTGEVRVKTRARRE